MSTHGENADVEAPRSVNKLRAGISAAARRRATTVKRTQSLVGNVVLAQTLPDSAVKGATGLKLRFGDRVTRETPDLDTAFRGDRDAFLMELNSNLKSGWGPFSGTATAGEQRAPEDLVARVTFAYVMQPVKVKLTYRGKPFMSIDLEVGYDELEATTGEDAELMISDEVRDLFAELGLPSPAPVRVLPLHHQISQKLHACTEPGSMRAHDLVDLQLMAPLTDPEQVRQTAIRLFAFRSTHSWPPTLDPAEGWAGRYADAAEGLTVLGLEAAVDWVNDYIRSCNTGARRPNQG